MATATATQTTSGPVCPCGCGASIEGWSGYLPKARRRVRRAAHGSCHFCGQAVDQYRQCQECD